MAYGDLSLLDCDSCLFYLVALSALALSHITTIVERVVQDWHFLLLLYIRYRFRLRLVQVVGHRQRGLLDCFVCLRQAARSAHSPALRGVTRSPMRWPSQRMPQSTAITVNIRWWGEHIQCEVIVTRVTPPRGVLRRCQRSVCWYYSAVEVLGRLPAPASAEEEAALTDQL